MYEINGVEYSKEEIQEAADSYDMEFDDYLKKITEKHTKQPKEASPIIPDPVMEVENTDSKSEDTSSESSLSQTSFSGQPIDFSQRIKKENVDEWGNPIEKKFTQEELDKGLPTFSVDDVSFFDDDDLITNKNETVGLNTSMGELYLSDKSKIKNIDEQLQKGKYNGAGFTPLNEEEVSKLEKEKEKLNVRIAPQEKQIEQVTSDKPWELLNVLVPHHASGPWTGVSTNPLNPTPQFNEGSKVVEKLNLDIEVNARIVDKIQTLNIGEKQNNWRFTNC